MKSDNQALEAEKKVKCLKRKKITFHHLLSVRMFWMLQSFWFGWFDFSGLESSQRLKCNTMPFGFTEQSSALLPTVVARFCLL